MQEMTSLAGEPVAVEFCYAGEWCPAGLVGWRHEPDGTCRVRIRFVYGGLRRASWMDLADLRLRQSEPSEAAPAAPTRSDLLLPDRDWSRPAPTTPPPLPVHRSGVTGDDSV
jgi:hypothetical protein